MSAQPNTFYVTTPIYYVNDQPHIGHVYTTTLADILARYHRLRGDRTFFLTGTDEHAAKVSEAAAERGLTPGQWAETNAGIFQSTFKRLGMSNDDFIRTSQDRHKQKVLAYIQQMMDKGDVYQGEYQGWYDASQEEYVPENKAKEYDYQSPVTGKPLVKKTEKNYFFRLSRYQQPLLAYFQQNPTFVQPEARRNEILARINDGLNDVPMSRTGSGGWGIPMPNDPEQTIYVWIDALFNYLTTVDTPDRLDFWPADHQLIAKDILWFHAVIWPAMLLSLDRPLPRQVYSHSYWISEGRKMSKSLGNFVDLAKLDQYVADFGLDALRYYLALRGPLGVTDADFAHDKFVDVYNADLANTLGNCASRVTNMLARYFDGRLPAPGPMDARASALRDEAEGLAAGIDAAYQRVDLAGAIDSAMALVRQVDQYIEQTQPFKLAKEPDQREALATILYTCCEALRIASLALSPVLPQTMARFWAMIDQAYDTDCGDIFNWMRWGGLAEGAAITKGKPLYPRHVPKND